MALHLRCLHVAVVVASALGSGDTEASTTAGALVVLGYRGPENGSEPLGLAAVGASGDPPPGPLLQPEWASGAHPSVHVHQATLAGRPRGVGAVWTWGSRLGQLGDDGPH